MAIKTVLIDLSGTLHIGSYSTPNAVQSLSRLRGSGVDIKFVTNTTKESRRCLHERLIEIGFQLKPQEIFTSLSATRQLIEKQNFKKTQLLLETAALEDFDGIGQVEGEETADAVVVGLSPSLFNYPSLNTAFRNILNGAQLIAVHKARYFKESSGLSLGPGPFVEGLEYATNTKAIVVGKPTAEFFSQALNGADAKTAVMIGDDVRDDIEGAQKLGMRGFLVQTGKYREGDETRIDPPPFKVSADFSHAVETILKSIND